MATDPKTLGDQPAVPHHQVEESETYTRTYAQHRGLTKREFFAGMALMGAPNSDANLAAQHALDVSDALLAKLAERQGGGL